MRKAKLEAKNPVVNLCPKYKFGVKSEVSGINLKCAVRF